MYCNDCGNYLKDEHRFCTRCGAPRPEAISGPKGTRWIPALILTLMIVLGCIVYFVTTANPSADDIPALSVRSGSLYFDENHHNGDPVLNVPDTVDGQAFTVVSSYCFENCDSLTSVTLPGTAERICAYAFFDCENLRTVRLQNGTRTIESNAFFSCGSLETIYIPDSTERIEYNAFNGCSRLKHIYFDGTQEDWDRICDTEISPNTQIHYVSFA